MGRHQPFLATAVLIHFVAMEVRVLGAGCDVGRSCFHLSFSGANLLLDCGAHPGFADARRFPDFASLGPLLSSLDAILISHFHLDHAAALPLLTEILRCTAPVYMTEPTRDLAQLMLSDFISTSAARRQHCPFTLSDARKCLSRVGLLRLGEITKIGKNGGINVTPYYAGHVLGAVMLHITVRKASVLYSGDYSTRSDRHLRSASVPFGLSPDLFITEATYCSTVRREGRRPQEDAMMKAVTDAVANGGKVLVPISAFGRVNAVCALFASHPDADLLKDVPLYIVAGLASKANSAYDRFVEWTAEAVNGDYHSCGEAAIEVSTRKRQRTQCPFVSRLQSFNRNSHWELLEAPGPMILFATPGNMSTGLSQDVFKLWASDSRNVIVVPGFCFSNTLASKLLARQGVRDENSEVPPVKCRLVNMTFSSHADARGIVRTCRKVKARAVMLVHGDKGKILAFRKQLSDALQVECFAPSNGQIVKIPMSPILRQDTEPAGTPAEDHMSDEWSNLIKTYVEHVGRLS